MGKLAAQYAITLETTMLLASYSIFRRTSEVVEDGCEAEATNSCIHGVKESSPVASLFLCLRLCMRF